MTMLVVQDMKTNARKRHTGETRWKNSDIVTTIVCSSKNHITNIGHAYTG